MSGGLVIKAQSATMVSTDKGAIGIGLELTIDQRKAAIVELLGNGWPEHEAYAFLRDEFSDWFSEVDA